MKGYGPQVCKWSCGYPAYDRDVCVAQVIGGDLDEDAAVLELQGFLS